MPPLATLVAQHDEIRSWRHQLHAHPELAFQEEWTSAFVAEKLREFGLEVHCGLARTGVVGVLHGARPGTHRIGLRADMDALPLTEANRFDHCSRVAGRMHSCGHDGHVTMLLAAARHLAAHPPLAGTAYFIFQPAEECEGGGRVMVEEGLFDRFPVDAIFGLHNWPGIEVGHFGIWPGPIMGSFDLFEIEVHGRGGHGSQPHLTVDPLVVTAQLITALQTLVSRTVDPLDAAVVSVTELRGGDTWNIIPAQVRLRGGARALTPRVRDQLEEGLRRIAAGIGAAFGAELRVEFRRFCPPTVSSGPEALLAARVAAELVGPAQVIREPRPSLAAEDFAFLLEQRPGCFLWLGNGPADDGKNLHSPHYDFNDAVLPLGASFWVRLVETFLGT